MGELLSEEELNSMFSSIDLKTAKQYGDALEDVPDALREAVKEAFLETQVNP